ncbi:bifunctional UDP-sugar hydrolase/5'-nucleotidase [Vitiosangium sp. GDMCC 1.1324]|uniref:bifunctional metallophosphatase/5'-nucleotidase n=1 Tax=Vitiosangium sp. (strain GDMCC 1.1324) TaxID=2138576 RepID=UPI000D380767|nr:5'-nucleotidase C-terminal domain-containing protein [Vitiosangium sp. GDMCC 1.1324]PTL85288.1 bifunctional metallophosphatase/5'-nucleotidase [Vitiosangium sp. GDMCC 1.1324]
MHQESDSKPAAGSNPWRRASGVVAFALVGALTGCDKNSAQEHKPAETAQPAQAPAAQPPAPKPTMVTVLVTGSPNGQLLSTTSEEGKPTTGAAELLGWWEAKEKHCAGQVKDGVAPCKDASTLALTIGDAWNGPAISSFFYGEPTAVAMGQMGFAASALGNHELDYGLEQFQKNHLAGGFPFLAANLKVKDSALAKGWHLPGYKVFERQGLKIGVVGLTSPKTVTTAMAGRAEGLEVIPDEQALTEAVAAAQKDGADTVVVLADECPTNLEPVVGKHPEWKVSLVAGGRCLQPVDTKQGNTSYVSLGLGFDKYLRAAYTYDASKPEGEQVTGVETSQVDVTGGEGAPAPNAELAKKISDYKTRLDTALGEQIGFTKKAFDKNSKQLLTWVTGAIREQLGTDAVVLNRKGFREGLPAGKVTKGSVYSVLPYENSLMVVEVKGADLAHQLENPEAVFSGFTAAGKGKFKDAKGKPLDPKKEYKVATIEYLYFGGDGFEFEKLDPEPGETGMSWQTPVIDWTKTQATTEAKPLDKVVK